ncbi:MAG: putative membrane protein (4 TMH) [Parcubacteria bacterium C7867-008]|nr:MAG: putative membrane protein (4 TMH) [Parcubacteria bacterium C7867-008]
MRLRWLLGTLLLALILLGVHLYALQNYLYWYYRWLDTPVHILGGTMMGAFIVGVFIKYRPYTYLLGIALGAIGWELFEYYFGISTGQTRYVWDTLHDILNDVIGAVALYVLARFTIWRSH